jgi:hypothetical protein
MDNNKYLIVFLILLLIVSVINYFWLYNNRYYSDGSLKTEYIGSINKWNNLEFRTVTYIYPKNWKSDKCYTDECNSNLIIDKTNAFHNELYNVGNNNVLILENEYNTAPLKLSISDLNIISQINKNFN